MFERDRNIDYYARLWEEKKDQEPDKAGVSQRWDEKASRWRRELYTDCSFRRSMDQRVRETAEFSRKNGLLTEGAEVLDIGCGPGRYAVEFAKTAGSVTGLDISEGMLAVAGEYAAKQRQNNIRFMSADFQTVDIEKLGWERRFDLVFASITPAINSLESLEKAIRVCRGFCFHSCFIYYADKLERLLSAELFHRERPGFGQWGKRSHYALFNLLYLLGYRPETRYHQQTLTEREKVTWDLARYYSSIFTEKNADPEENLRRVFSFLEAKADGEGLVEQRLERCYAWTIWDVRINDGRGIFTP